nr:hypothetical protein [Tanacetum cinerariifolium]
MCEWCRNDLLDGFCSLCNSRNSYVYDPNSNSFDCPPDSGHPPHPTYETYSCDSCGNDSHFGYDCQPQFPLNYESEPGYIQNYNSYLHDSLIFPQQYLCCDNCGGLHETFQCQPMNQNLYNFNSFGFDQSQPLQFPVIHQPPQETSIEILHGQEKAINSVQTFLRKFNRYSFFKTPKVLLLAWDRVSKLLETSNINRRIYKSCFVNFLMMCKIFMRSWLNDGEDYAIAITPDFLTTDSLIMGDEHLDTIPEKESDEFIKSSVETLVPNPSEFEDDCECDVPDCDDSQTTNFATFSNPLFDDSTSSDDESSHEVVIHEMNLDSTPKNDRFDTESYLLESLLNRDTLMASTLKIDSLLAEFAGELIFLKSIPPGIDEANYDPDEDIHLVERLLDLSFTWEATNLCKKQGV